METSTACRIPSYIISLVLMLWFIGALIGLGVYQAQTMSSFLSSSPATWIPACKRPLSGSLCTVDNDRFWTIGAGSIVTTVGFLLAVPFFISVWLRKLTDKQAFLIGATIFAAVIFIHWIGLVVFEVVWHHY